MGNISKRLAFSTLGCPEWSMGQIISNAEQMGFSSVEVRGVRDELRVELLSDFMPESREKTTAMLKKAHLSICAFGTSCMFHEEQTYEEALREGVSAVDLAVTTGVKAIRVFGDRLSEDSPRESVLDRIERGIGGLCDYAEGAGDVSVLLEIHGDINKTEVLRDVIAALGPRKAFGLVWDIEHSFRAYGTQYQDFYRTISPFVRHVHIKDCVMDGAVARPCLPGDGEINISDIVRTLENGGYTGFYSFEWEKRWVQDLPGPEIAFPAYVKYMETIFSDAGDGNGQNT